MERAAGYNPAGDCLTCEQIRRMLTEVELEVARHGLEALERGPEWGVLVTVPEELTASFNAEQADLDAAKRSGIFVGLVRTPDLSALLGADDKGQDVPRHAHSVTQLVEELSRPARAGEVRVLAALSGCVATITCHPTPEIVDRLHCARERNKRFSRLWDHGAFQVAQMLRSRTADWKNDRVFLVTDVADPILDKLQPADTLNLRKIADSAKETGRESLFVRSIRGEELLSAIDVEDMADGEAERLGAMLRQPPPSKIQVVLVYDGQVSLVTTDTTYLMTLKLLS